MCDVCFYLQYTDLALYTQLSFYLYIFDFEKAVNSLDNIKERGNFDFISNFTLTCAVRTANITISSY